MRINVCVGVVTYKRKNLIVKLIQALNSQDVLNYNSYTFSLVIVNNDIEEDICNFIKEAINGERWRLIYSIEEKNGVVFARNRLLSLVPHDCDYLFMIDDDEIPVNNWISSHISSIESQKSDFSSGPVIPNFEIQPEDWIIEGGFHDRQRFKTGDNPGITRTGNLCLTKKCLTFGLLFDERLNNTGGEDSLYIEKLIAKNMKHTWCDEASVYEFVPKNRLSIKWICFRAMRIGNSGVKYRLLLKPNIIEILTSYCKTLVLIIVSLISFILYPLFGKVKKARVKVFGSRVIGRLKAHLGRDVNEY